MERDEEKRIEEQSILFELRTPLPDGRLLLVERTPDESSVRMAFDAVRKVLSNMAPRPKAAIELYLGTTVLDVFEQTAEGEESEPSTMTA